MKKMIKNVSEMLVKLMVEVKCMKQTDFIGLRGM